MSVYTWVLRFCFGLVLAYAGNMAGKDRKGKGQEKGKWWATILYPESAVDGWTDIIASWHLPALVSPIHDRDVKEGGELKKPHYHVMVSFKTGAVTGSYVKQLFDSIGGVGLERVKSERGMARYLCHLDDENKVKYDPEDVISFGGYEYGAFLTEKNNDDVKRAEKMRITAEIMHWCMDEGCDSFAQLCMYAEKYNKEWFLFLCENGASSMIYRFLRSLEYDRERVIRRMRRDDEIVTTA